uniref:Bm14282 n=1 Tax=Brugia malayi TaxID=6279 RepID=A0A1I9G4P2_BRUMA|nr:Bm14282 [Brugia malayi]
MEAWDRRTTSKQNGVLIYSAQKVCLYMFVHIHV